MPYLTLNFNNDWKYHWSPLSFSIYKLSDLVSHQSFDVIHVHFVFIGNAIQNALYFLSDAIQHFFVFFKINETARNDVRIFKNFSVVAVQRCDNYHHTFFGKGQAISENYLANVT